MARANFVKKAQKDIYAQGKSVSYVSEKGKRKGETKYKIDRTLPANGNDKVIIKAGESYYWWQFKNASKQYSKDRPKNSQLTQSVYLSTLYGIMETIEAISTDQPEDIEGIIEDIKSQLEELRDTTQESLDNMPEGLQQGATGELLQERIDALESAISDMENIDTSFEEPDEDELRSQAAEDNDIDTDEVGWEEKVTQDMMNDVRNEKAREWIDEVVNELQGISLE